MPVGRVFILREYQPFVCLTSLLRRNMFCALDRFEGRFFALAAWCALLLTDIFMINQRQKSLILTLK